MTIALYCAVPYIAACVDVSKTVFRDRSQVTLGFTEHCSTALVNPVAAIDSVFYKCTGGIQFKVVTTSGQQIIDLDNDTM